MFKKAVCLLLLASTVLSFPSCSLLTEDEPSTGVGNVTAPASTAEGKESTAPVESGEGTSTTDGTTAPNTTPVSGEVSAVTDFSFLADKTGRFPDVNADDTLDTWYPGKFTRDLTTGEVTVVWDRNQATIDMVEQYGGIYKGDTTRKVCYLTFDCGYEYRCDEYPNGVTNDILDTLKEKNVKATFFVTGDYIEGDSDIVKRMLDEGNVVGTHTMHHYHQVELSPEEFVAEIMDNQTLLNSKIPDAPDMVFYRPPEGGANEKTLALAEAMGLTTVFWSVAQKDSKYRSDYNPDNQPDPVSTLENDKLSLHNGAVFLIHAVSVTNAQILGDLIDYIEGEGYSIELMTQK